MTDKKISSSNDLTVISNQDSLHNGLANTDSVMEDIHGSANVRDKIEHVEAPAESKSDESKGDNIDYSVNLKKQQYLEAIAESKVDAVKADMRDDTTNIGIQQQLVEQEGSKSYGDAFNPIEMKDDKPNDILRLKQQQISDKEGSKVSSADSSRDIVKETRISDDPKLGISQLNNIISQDKPKEALPSHIEPKLRNHNFDKTFLIMNRVDLKGLMIRKQIGWSLVNILHQPEPYLTFNLTCSRNKYNYENWSPRTHIRKNGSKNIRWLLDETITDEKKNNSTAAQTNNPPSGMIGQDIWRLSFEKDQLSSATLQIQLMDSGSAYSDYVLGSGRFALSQLAEMGTGADPVDIFITLEDGSGQEVGRLVLKIVFEDFPSQSITTPLPSHNLGKRQFPSPNRAGDLVSNSLSTVDQSQKTRQDTNLLGSSSTEERDAARGSLSASFRHQSPSMSAVLPNKGNSETKPSSEAPNASTSFTKSPDKLSLVSNMGGNYGVATLRVLAITGSQLNLHSKQQNQQQQHWSRFRVETKMTALSTNGSIRESGPSAAATAASLAVVLSFTAPRTIAALAGHTQRWAWCPRSDSAVIQSQKRDEKEKDGLQPSSAADGDAGRQGATVVWDLQKTVKEDDGDGKRRGGWELAMRKEELIYGTLRAAVFTTAQGSHDELLGEGEARLVPFFEAQQQQKQGSKEGEDTDTVEVSLELINLRKREVNCGHIHITLQIESHSLGTHQNRNLTQPTSSSIIKYSSIKQPDTSSSEHSSSNLRHTVASDVDMNSSFVIFRIHSIRLKALKDSEFDMFSDQNDPYVTFDICPLEKIPSEKATRKEDQSNEQKGLHKEKKSGKSGSDWSRVTDVKWNAAAEAEWSMGDTDPKWCATVSRDDVQTLGLFIRVKNAYSLADDMPIGEYFLSFSSLLEQSGRKEGTLIETDIVLKNTTSDNVSGMGTLTTSVIPDTHSQKLPMNVASESYPKLALKGIQKVILGVKRIELMDVRRYHNKDNLFVRVYQISKDFLNDDDMSRKRTSLGQKQQESYILKELLRGSKRIKQAKWQPSTLTLWESGNYSSWDILDDDIKWKTVISRDDLVFGVIGVTVSHRSKDSLEAEVVAVGQVRLLRLEDVGVTGEVVEVQSDLLNKDWKSGGMIKISLYLNAYQPSADAILEESSIQESSNMNLTMDGLNFNTTLQGPVTQSLDQGVNKSFLGHLVLFSIHRLDIRHIKSYVDYRFYERNFLDLFAILSFNPHLNMQAIYNYYGPIDTNKFWNPRTVTRWRRRNNVGWGFDFEDKDWNLVILLDDLSTRSIRITLVDCSRSTGETIVGEASLPLSSWLQSQTAGQPFDLIMHLFDTKQRECGVATLCVSLRDPPRDEYDIEDPPMDNSTMMPSGVTDGKKSKIVANRPNGTAEDHKSDGKKGDEELDEESQRILETPMKTILPLYISLFIPLVLLAEKVVTIIFRGSTMSDFLVYGSFICMDIVFVCIVYLLWNIKSLVLNGLICGIYFMAVGALCSYFCSFKMYTLVIFGFLCFVEIILVVSVGKLSNSFSLPDATQHRRETLIKGEDQERKTKPTQSLSMTVISFTFDLFILILKDAYGFIFISGNTNILFHDITYRMLFIVYLWAMLTQSNILLNSVFNSDGKRLRILWILCNFFNILSEVFGIGFVIYILVNCVVVMLKNSYNRTYRIFLIYGIISSVIVLIIFCFYLIRRRSSMKKRGNKGIYVFDYGS